MSKFDLISRGIKIMDPGDFSALSAALGTASLETTGFPEGGPAKAVKVTFPSSGTAHGQIQNLSPYIDIPAQAGITGLLVEVFNPNAHPMPFHMILYNESVAQRAECHMACDVSSGWQLCWIPTADWAYKTFIDADEVRTVRYQLRADYAHGWSPVDGEALYFGRAYINPVQVPVFLLSADDGTTANIAAQTTANPRKSYLEICQYYGFRATAYIVPDWVGDSGYMTEANLDTLQDAGWSLGSHSMTHPVPILGSEDPNNGNPGLRLLGPYGVSRNALYGGPYAGAANDDTAIYNDVVSAVQWGLSRGYTGFRHFALPQGGWDAYVRSACVHAKADGFLSSVRGISLPTKGFPIRGSINVGPSAGTLQANTQLWSGWVDLPGSVQVDGAPTQADILAYYTEGKRVGATMSNYTHGPNGLVNFDYLCSLLRTDQDAGLIRVMTVEEYYDATVDWGGRSPSTGTLTLTPIKHGDTATPVADVNRVVQSTKEFTSKQVDKYVNSEMIFTLTEGTILRG